tara:strand:+ start:540 stop:1184 length:645 start_codon:yes stop_codon:yes gene_type:complete
MYNKHGWYFPDYDTHFAEMLDKNIAKGNQPVYQQPVRKRSFTYLKNNNFAIDVGANVGLWTKDMSEEFTFVWAIEPVEDFRQCLQKNIFNNNVDIKPFALGAENTVIDMIITEENTGHSHVDIDSLGKGTIPMHRLDDLNIPPLDYIKIDCEGYELNVLKGAEQTIKKHKPIIVIEQKFHKDVGHVDDGEAVTLLRSFGARQLDKVRNDLIFGW